MTVSGTIAFGLDVDSIIRDALEKIGGEPTLGEDSRSARRSLNLLLIDWQNRGIPLWKRDEQSFTVSASSGTYALTSGTIDVLDAVCRRSNTDLQMTRITPEEYLNIPRKTQSSRPTQYYIDRQRETTSLVLWPLPDNSTDEIHYWRFSKIYDVNSPTEDADVPFRFLPALIAGLAYMMSIKRTGIPLERIAILKQDYMESLQVAMEEDRDRASLFITPKQRYL